MEFINNISCLNFLGDFLHPYILSCSPWPASRILVSTPSSVLAVSTFLLVCRSICSCRESRHRQLPFKFRGIRTCHVRLTQLGCTSLVKLPLLIVSSVPRVWYLWGLRHL